MSNRTALITGAAGDIGAAAARAFAEGGADVVVTDRRGDALKEVAAAVREAGAQVLAHACDQTDPEAVAGLFEAIRGRFGRLDAAFINAGYGRYGALIDLPYDQWKKHVDVNLNGGFLMAQGAARLMRDGGAGGAIVMNASTAATHICDLLGAYAASKSGVHRLTEALAEELAGDGVTVNAVLPSIIDTPTNRADMPDADTSQWVQPAAIGDVILFLASPAARAVTGALIPVTRGG